MNNIMILGHGRHGKDESAAILSKYTGLKYSGSSSYYLCDYAAAELGVSWQEAYDNRHANRAFWYNLGKRLRSEDPGLLVKKCLEHGNIVAGFRELCEIEFAINSGMIQHVVWVERDFELDPTMDFTLSDVSRTIAKAPFATTLDVVFNRTTDENLFRIGLTAQLHKLALYRDFPISY